MSSEHERPGLNLAQRNGERWGFADVKSGGRSRESSVANGVTPVDRRPVPVRVAPDSRVEGGGPIKEPEPLRPVRPSRGVTWREKRRGSPEKRRMEMFSQSTTSVSFRLNLNCIKSHTLTVVNLLIPGSKDSVRCDTHDTYN